MSVCISYLLAWNRQNENFTLSHFALVNQTVFTEVPLRVERLTEMALEFGPTFKQLSNWDGKHRSFKKTDLGNVKPGTTISQGLSEAVNVSHQIVRYLP